MISIRSLAYRTIGALLVGGALATGAGTAEADTLTPMAAANESVAINAVATAARLCNVISESQLNRAVTRMDAVHTRQLSAEDRETYLILRGSESFRNRVFASALERVRSGCGAEVTQVWREIAASLMFADIVSQDAVASSSLAPQTQN